MSSFELNKIVGAVLCVGLVSLVISMIGNALVQPRDYQPSEMKIAEAAATGAKKTSQTRANCAFTCLSKC